MALHGRKLVIEVEVVDDEDNMAWAMCCCDGFWVTGFDENAVWKIKMNTKRDRIIHMLINVDVDDFEWTAAFFFSDIL